MSEIPAAEIAHQAMQDALVDGENERIDPESVEPAPLLTWPSTISEIDDVCQFYGLTTVGAARGTGKTLLAIASAIEAAISGKWQVCYFAAEDDEDGLSVRFNNFLNSRPGPVTNLGNFHLFSAARGQTPESLTDEIAKAIDLTADIPVLVVIDSINSLVEMSRYSYLDGLVQFGLWMMLARRYSRGAASFLCISETNKSGSVKGEKLPFWSDVLLVMKRGPSDVVEMDLQKSRRTRCPGELGKFIRVWSSGEFISQGEIEGLRVVQGGREKTKPDLLTPAEAETNAGLF